MSVVHGFYGKIRERGDFVRFQVTSNEALNLARWLEASLEACQRAQCDLPAGNTHFVFRTEGCNHVLAGVIHPTQDQVGRLFPSAIFTTVDLAQTAAEFSSIPFALQPFLRAADRLADVAGDLSVEDLAQKVADLPTHSSADFIQAHDRISQLVRFTSMSSFLRELFFRPAELRYYAFRSFALACEQSRNLVIDTKPGITVECPCQDDEHQVIWLEMARILLGAQAVPPALLWTGFKPPRNYGSIRLRVPTEAPPEDGRLLLSFGAPTPLGLSFMASQANQSAKLWPLQSDNERAIESAKSGLTEQQRAALDDVAATLESILSAFIG